MDSQILYKVLINLRTNLKLQNTTNGRAPVICSDEALLEMAYKKPKTKDELLAINGIGKTFIEKYGDFFIAEILKSENVQHHVVPMTESVEKILKSLENRLVNISKKNRLLYMSKIQSKHAFDMYNEDYAYNRNVLDLITGKTKSLRLCEISENGFWEEFESKRFKSALVLLREITKQYRETGNYDLYIGYPYVVGKTKGEDFNVKAPLMLFPIEFIKEQDVITISLDKHKDILYNTNLILMQNKFLGNNNILPDCEVEEFTQTYFEDMLKFYNENGIKISGSLGELEPFSNVTQEYFNNFKAGEFIIQNNAVLGNFSIYSSALQRDFQEIINSNQVSSLVEELIEDIGNKDKPTSSVMNIQKVDNYLERDLNYINELNASQEQSILATEKTDKLVIQGPPGTGKSQTITSLIADAVVKGKNVLMVSQKKAALDVIRSRMGNLSNYLIMINDVKDKQAFYGQVANLLKAQQSSNFHQDEHDNICANIDAFVDQLNDVKNKLYNYKVCDTQIYKIYENNEENYFKNNINKIDLYNTQKALELLNINYNKLKNIKIKFSDEQVLNNCIEYLKIVEKVPQIKNIQDNLSYVNKLEMKKEIDCFVADQKDYLNKNFIVKLFKKSKRKKSLNSIFDKYFKNKLDYNVIFKNPTILTEIFNNYNSYQGTKVIYHSLSDEEIKYLMATNEISTLNNIASCEVSNNLIDFIAYCHIDEFENKNRDVFMTISKYPQIVSKICKFMDSKIRVTKELLKSIFIETYRNEIVFSKRYNEICRQIESRRKWNITKFINKFSLELTRGIKVWLMTPETVSEIFPLENAMFDYLIFDEASQIYVEKGIPAITRAKKVIIAGDHKQLKPSSLGFGRIEYSEDEDIEVEEELTAALEEDSLLDLAKYKYPSVMLNYHYRAKFEELINFSNYAFYDGKLNVSPNIDKSIEPPIKVVKIEDGLWDNRHNYNEALKVVELTKQFLLNRKNNETIGIITFNSQQKTLIEDLIDYECVKDAEISKLFKTEFERKENGEDIGLFVKNIENVQGDERDNIIFSIGYAKNKDGKVVRNFGWLNQVGGENRLNVAISRAKKSITVVTSIFPAELVVDDLTNNGPKIFRKYLEYAWAVSNKDKQMTELILNSFVDNKDKQEQINVEFVGRVKEELENKGLKVDCYVGVGDYKIDIAIKDQTNSKYILGIECNGDIYHSCTNTRERDIFKQKYLNVRGWNTYRLYASNWWHNKENEIQKIIKLCDENK